MSTLTSAQALRLLRTVELRPFTVDDWDAFAGCESDSPEIGVSEDGWTVVVDGDVVQFSREDEHLVLSLELEEI